MSALKGPPRAPRLQDVAVRQQPPGQGFDRVFRLAGRLFGVAGVAVDLVIDDGQFIRTTPGAEVGTVARDQSVSSHVVETGKPLVIADARADVRFRDDPAIREASNTRFYAGMPLRAPTGESIGALCIFDDRPRTLSDDELMLLADLAAWLGNELNVERELAQGGEVQRWLLPAEPPDLPGLETAGRCLSARDLGGDFFDWQVVDRRLQVVVADVMGNDISAALISSHVRATLRDASRYNDLSDAVTTTAVRLEKDLEELASFVTLFVARIDPVSGEVEYVDAGHGLGVIVSGSRPPRRLVSSNLPIGVLAGDTWESGKDQLAEDEFLLAVSDGILEVFPDIATALERAGELSTNHPSPDEFVDRVIRFASDRDSSDDLTAVVVRRRPLEEPR